MKTSNTITLPNFHLLIPRTLRGLFCLHSKVPQSEKAGFHSLGPQNLPCIILFTKEHKSLLSDWSTYVPQGGGDPVGDSRYLLGFKKRFSYLLI